ncbi:hypothetical protein EXIGLDRAFT_753431 [Exidia glandulosa HHB12029]|uniref:DUF6535 domain-containing protein n=1 Tax=Exidia glandulosa HHB12029 TaxID=1314781 RepID=A0A165DRK3_EXIGL|nr:hypothetical protein EXIGLDRAFT_753431 [Exidia glandulosa HHB12029]
MAEKMTQYLAARIMSATGANGVPDDRPSANTRSPDEPVSEFDKKYPPDAYGEEMSDTARVWTVYRDQASEYDERHVDGWNKTLDILLIFAGLFSAVATTFIGESYQQLQTDWNEYTGRLLFATLAAQNTPGKFTLPSSLQSMSPSDFSASGLARWINGLWVSSLVLSLAVALLSILAKQWLVQFESRVTAPARSTRDWAHRRVLYADGLKQWHLAYIIAALPALLHLSLVLFLSGLALFFWTLDVGIASAVIVFTTILVVAYFSTIFLSYRHRACPFYLAWFTQVHRALNFVHERFTKLLPWSEARLMKEYQPYLSASVLTWLATYSPAHEVNAVGIYAIGSLRSTSQVIERIYQFDIPLKRSLLNKLVDLNDVVYSALLTPRGTSGLQSPKADEEVDDGALPPAAYNYLRNSGLA